MNKVKLKDVRKKLKEAHLSTSLQILQQVMASLKGDTPVVTGETQASWYFYVDGRQIADGDLTLDDLRDATELSIRNTKGWIGELDDKYGIIALTDHKMRDLKP